MSVSRLPDAWRRENCSPGCWSRPVYFVGDRKPRVVVCHDVDAHEASVRVNQPEARLVFGRLTIDPNLRLVLLDGQQLHVSATEFNVLRYLAVRAGTVCPLNEIVTAIWGATYTDGGHLVRVTVARLRARLREAGGLIQTHTGHGLLMPEPQSVGDVFPPRVRSQIGCVPEFLGPRQTRAFAFLKDRPGVWVQLSAVHSAMDCKPEKALESMRGLVARHPRVEGRYADGRLVAVCYVDGAP